MSRRPTYEELKQRVEELEKKAASRTEKALLESKELFEKTFLALKDAIFILDAGIPPKIVDCNPAAVEMFGYAHEEMLGRTTVFLHVSEETLRKFQEDLYPQTENRGFFYMPEFEMKRKNGVIFSTEHTVVPLIAEDGQRIGWVSVIHDITGRKLAEETIAREKEKFQVLVEKSPLGVALIGSDGHYRYINPKFVEIFGYTLEDVPTGREWFKKAYPDPEYRNEVKSIWIKNYKESGVGESRPQTFTVTCKNGSEKLIHFRTVTMETGDHFIIYENITERRQAEEALRQSEARYRQMVEYAPTAIYEVDPINFKLVKANDVMCQILGYTEEELLSIDPLVLFSDESKQLLLERTAKILAGEKIPDTVEYKVRRKDGSELWALVNTRVFYKQGKPVGAISIAQDISERKRLEEQLLQAQKMKALGTMASGVAHNFRNVLAVISMQSQILQMKYGDSPKLNDIAERVNTYVERGAQLVDSLMHFSKRETKKEYQPLNLAEVIRETSQLVGISFDKMITTHIKTPKSLPVLGSHAELSQVLMNLYANARDAMPKGGELRVEASKQDRKAMVVVTDTGYGMDKETQERCFDPFFTTKEISKGTGLGLSTTYGIVKEHGGEIHVSSKLGHGTTFKLYFPLAPSDEREEQESSNRFIRGKGQKILIVDDETDMCKLMEDLLETLGYQVASVNSGEGAITKYASWTPDAVLLDRNMPEMDGISCAEKIMDKDPNAKIVIMSGYGENESSGMPKEKRKLIKGYMTKPVNMNQLSTHLSQLLK